MTTAAQSAAGAPDDARFPAGPVQTSGDGSSVMPRGLAILLGAAATVVIVWGFREIAWLVGPAFLALIIVIATSPVQGWLRRHGFPQWAATLVLIVVVYALLIGLALTMVVSVARLATVLPQYADHAHQLFAAARGFMGRLGISADQLRAASSSLSFGTVLGVVASLLSTIAGLATNLVFLLALLLFLAVEAGGGGARLAAMAADRPSTAGGLADFARRTRSFLLVTTVFGAIVAVLDTAALALLGIPLAVLWGLLAFITNYIPNLGFILGLVPPALLALLSGGWQLMVIVIVIYGVLNFVVQSLIQPRFVGNSVGLSITITFVALAFWTWVLGAIGALLAVPLTLLVKAVLIDADPRAGVADALVRSARPARTVTAGRTRAR